MTVLRGVTSCTLAVRYSLFSCVHKNRTTQTPDFPYSLLVKYQRTGVTFYSSILRKGSRCLQNTGLCLSHYPSIHPSIHSFIHLPIHPSVCRLATFGLPVCLPNNTLLHPSGQCNLYFSISSICRTTGTQLWDSHVISARLCYLELQPNFPSSCGRSGKSRTVTLGWDIPVVLIKSQLWQTYSQNTTIFIIATGGTLSYQQLHVSAPIFAIFRLCSFLL